MIFLSILPSVMKKKRVPAYLRIEKHLQSLILAGGGRLHPLPAEPDLAAEFKVSRMTARQAYQRLAAAGVIVRRPGIGSFVTGHVVEELPVRGVPDFSAWIRGDETTRRVVEYATIAAPAAIARALGIKSGARVTHLHRVRHINGVPSIDQRYMPASVHAKISRAQIERDSILKLLNDAGFRIGAGQVEIDAHRASAEEAAQLGIEAGHPVLERRLEYRDAKGRCVLVGTSRYPAGNAYTFRFQFQTGTGPSTPAR
jgi:GntR family transcriptional regulator